MENWIFLVILSCFVIPGLIFIEGKLDNKSNDDSRVINNFKRKIVDVIFALYFSLLLVMLPTLIVITTFIYNVDNKKHWEINI